MHTLRDERIDILHERMIEGKQEMKKTIAILMILAVVLSGVFAADTAQVTLSSTIVGKFMFGISQDSVPKYASMPDDSPYTSAIDFNDAFTNPSAVYFGYITNISYGAAVPSVQVTATPFRHADNASLTVGYDISTEDENGVEIALKTVSNSNENLVLNFSELGKNGLRQQESKMIFTADAGEVSKATAGSYTATITFEVSGK